MFPEKWSLDHLCRHAFAEIIINQQFIIENQGKLMSKLTDVQGKLSTLQQDVDLLVAKQVTGGATDADLDALGVQVDGIEASVQAALNPPPAQAVDAPKPE